MALGKYEVVVLIDAANPADKIDEIKKSVENLITEFGGKILDKDDIWHMETLYEIWSSNNPYFYSLYTELEGETIKEFKRKLGIIPGVVRYKIFKMKPNQKFLKMKDITKELEQLDMSNLIKSGIFNEIDKWTSEEK